MAQNRKKLTTSYPLVGRDMTIAKSASGELNLSSRTVRSRKGKGSFSRREKHSIAY